MKEKIWNILVTISNIVLNILIMAMISFIFIIPLGFCCIKGLWWLFGIVLIVELAIVVLFIDNERRH